VRDREGAPLVALVLLVGVVERFEEGLLLVRVVLVGLRLRKLVDAVIRHDVLLDGRKVSLELKRRATSAAASKVRNGLRGIADRTRGKRASASYSGAVGQAMSAR
jgi:hypothetical protein